MTEEQIGSLDIEFARFNLHSNRIIEGVGLGMPIVYQLASMMEGGIAVESKVGRGSTITVRIPQKPGSSSALGKETSENLRNFKISQKSLRKISNEAALIPMPYGRVLVVDDVDSNLYVAKGLLNLYKIAVETASNGHDAIEKIKAGETYDIIFMDHMMPSMDGIEATKILRQMGYAHPIVALTANALKDAPQMFLSNGFSGFLPKPIDIDLFNSCLDRHIRSKHQSAAPEAEGLRSGAENGSALPCSLRESFLMDARKALGTLEPLIRPLAQGQELGRDRLKSFVIQTHAMKSALCNIGQAELARDASMLEAAGRAADEETIKTAAPQFLGKLEKLAAELSPKEDADQDAPGDEDLDFLRAQFGIIAYACWQLDISTANRTLERLRETRCSKKTLELIKGISASLLYGDFDEAAALANQAASGIQFIP